MSIEAKKIKQDSSGNHFSSIKDQCFTKWCFGVVDLHGTLGIVDLIADLKPKSLIFILKSICSMKLRCEALL
jgi:hypothetical protein